MTTSVWKALRSGPMDVVVGTSPPIFQAVSAWFVASLRRKPFVLEVRDLWPDFAVEMGVLNNKFIIWLARRLELFLYARAAHIVVNSPAYRQHVVGKGVPTHMVTVVPNGVDPTMFDPTDKAPDMRRRWGVDGKFVVTYAGALGQANDIPTVLRAADRLRNEDWIQFLFVGDGKERARLELLAQQSGLTNVRFVGAVPKSSIPQVLAASDVCLAILQDIPMFTKTYPNKVFDYMAAGRPTLLAIDGVIRGVVDAAGGGIFVPPGDDGSLAESVMALATNPDRCASLGRAARQYVEAHFHRDEHARRFEEVLEDVTSR